jgi:hypothetical protein
MSAAKKGHPAASFKIAQYLEDSGYEGDDYTAIIRKTGLTRMTMAKKDLSGARKW